VSYPEEVGIFPPSHRDGRLKVFSFLFVSQFGCLQVFIFFFFPLSIFGEAAGNERFFFRAVERVFLPCREGLSLNNFEPDSPFPSFLPLFFLPLPSAGRFPFSVEISFSAMEKQFEVLHSPPSPSGLFARRIIRALKQPLLRSAKRVLCKAFSFPLSQKSSSIPSLLLDVAEVESARHFLLDRRMVKAKLFLFSSLFLENSRAALLPFPLMGRGEAVASVLFLPFLYPSEDLVHTSKYPLFFEGRFSSSPSFDLSGQGL